MEVNRDRLSATCDTESVFEFAQLPFAANKRSCLRHRWCGGGYRPLQRSGPAMPQYSQNFSTAWSLFRLAAQQADAEVVKLRRSIGHEFARLRRIEVLFIHHHFVKLAGKRKPAGKRLIKHYTHAVPIAGA